ncbi:ATP-binding protein [Ramlibacter tataouinensis]|uniref:hybrid sensor histidine kinase/response regulator n=1 Tax=Ramlibacter tataouinensis TaxID=94132 RepID=UPI0007777904|nr:ATP-binding protein [Ramlibacter tataouinensis]
MIFEERRQRWLVAASVFLVAGIVLAALYALGTPRVPLLPLVAAAMVAAFCSGPGPALTLLLVSLAASVLVWGQSFGVRWPITTALDWALFAVLFLTGFLGATWSGRVLREARQHQQRLDVALSVASMTSWEWDIPRNHFITTANAREVFGATPTTVEQAWQMVHPEDLEQSQAGLRKALQQGTTYRNLARYIHQADGEVRWIETHGHIQRNEKGEPVRMAGVSMDVTERQVALRSSQQAEERLQKEAQRKDAFLATLAHELRNPMAPIRYAVAMLGMDSTPSRLAQAKEIIERQSTHISRLLDDLLDMSRITRNAIELKREALDLRDVVEEAARNLRQSSPRHPVGVSLPTSTVPVEGDVTRLQQVLGNLLDNAARYSDPGAEISLSLGVEDAEAVLRVRDRGVGISPEQQAEIFELFTQLRPERGRGGLGIGLTVVKQLVELHGGTVAVRSDGPGRGSEFSVRLPLSKASLARPSGVEASKLVHRPDSARTVLIVDDNVDAAESLAMVMREMGYSVRTAFDGEGALRAYDEAKPALVLLDIGLPDMSGYEVAQTMRRRDGFVSALVAITGWGQEKDRSESAAAGFDLHLVKPVDPYELQARVTELMDKPRAGQPGPGRQASSG